MKKFYIKLFKSPIKQFGQKVDSDGYGFYYKTIYLLGYIFNVNKYPNISGIRFGKYKIYIKICISHKQDVELYLLHK